MFRPLLKPLLIILAMIQTAVAQSLLIDDFEAKGTASIGGQWQWSTDQVMGGVSTGRAQYVDWQGDQGVLIQGQVSTANNGGFIQVSLSFGGLLDASAYAGIELRVRGNGQPYWLHLRDRSSRLPWQVFNAAYQTDGSWQRVRVPFTDFAPYAGTTRGTLNPAALRQIGLVAGYADFAAELIVSEVRFYK